MTIGLRKIWKRNKTKRGTMIKERGRFCLTIEPANYNEFAADTWRIGGYGEISYHKKAYCYLSVYLTMGHTIISFTVRLWCKV
jgi:hypothetical protein